MHLLRPVRKRVPGQGSDDGLYQGEQGPSHRQRVPGVRKMRRCLRIPLDKDKNDMEAVGEHRAESIEGHRVMPATPEAMVLAAEKLIAP